MGYLLCEKCGGYYELKEGEHPEDFEENCECGGKLKHFNSLSGVPKKKEDFEPKDRKSDSGPKPGKRKKYLLIGILIVVISIFLIVAYLPQVGSTITPETKNVTIINSNGGYSNGFYYVWGELQNNNPFGVAYVEINMTGYDNKGNVVGTGWGYADNMNLPPGGKSTFNRTIKDPDNRIVRYEVQIKTCSKSLYKNDSPTSTSSTSADKTEKMKDIENSAEFKSAINQFVADVYGGFGDPQIKSLSVSDMISDTEIKVSLTVERTDYNTGAKVTDSMYGTWIKKDGKWTDTDNFIKT